MPPTGDFARKLHPWLRIVKNGGQEVNAVRSDGSARMACAAAVDAAGLETAPIYEQLANQVMSVPRWTASVEPPRAKLGKRLKLPDTKPAADSYINVFIEFFPEQQDGKGGTGNEMARVTELIQNTQKASVNSLPMEAIARRNFVCATVPVTMLDDLSQDPAIAFVHPSDPLALDRPEVASAPPGKKPTSKAIGNAKKYGRGESVLIGIIDVGGFDFAHPDFLDDNGQTRFVAIWDQGGDFRPPPKGFSRSAEFRQQDLNAAIEAAKKSGLPPAAWIERQSQLKAGSHGTHVTSIVAGNSGVCPKAKIAAVLIDIPATEDDVERRRSTFSDTSSIVHAVEYLLKIAQEVDLPISINISLGTNGGSHDGSSGVSHGLMPTSLSPADRSVWRPATPDKRRHNPKETSVGSWAGFTRAAKFPRGLEVEIEWTVVGDGIGRLVGE